MIKALALISFLSFNSIPNQKIVIDTDNYRKETLLVYNRLPDSTTPNAPINSEPLVFFEQNSFKEYNFYLQYYMEIQIEYWQPKKVITNAGNGVLSKITYTTECQIYGQILNEPWNKNNYIYIMEFNFNHIIFLEQYDVSDISWSTQYIWPSMKVDIVSVTNPDTGDDKLTYNYEYVLLTDDRTLVENQTNAASDMTWENLTDFPEESYYLSNWLNIHGIKNIFWTPGNLMSIYSAGWGDRSQFDNSEIGSGDYNKGYQDGYKAGESNGNISINQILSSAFKGVSSFLDVNLIGGIKLWHLVAIPLIFGIVRFILGFFK